MKSAIAEMFINEITGDSSVKLEDADGNPIEIGSSIPLYDTGVEYIVGRKGGNSHVNLVTSANSGFSRKACGIELVRDGDGNLRVKATNYGSVLSMHAIHNNSDNFVLLDTPVIINNDTNTFYIGCPPSLTGTIGIYPDPCIEITVKIL